jgi:hypothetical protein
MSKKNYKKIANEILNNDNMEPMQINVDPKHREYIEGAAERMDLSVTDAATFLLYAYINDVMLAAKQNQLQNMNPN